MTMHQKFSRLISMILTFCMLMSVLPTSVLAARTNDGTEQAGEMEVEVTEEMAASLVSSLTGEAVSNPSVTEDGYCFKVSETWGHTINAAVSDKLDDADSAMHNTLPDGYVDTSNDALYEILEQINSMQATLSSPSKETQVDLVFVIDSTGSMYSAIANVKENVAEFAKQFAEIGVTLRLALIDYRDIAEDGLDSTTVHQPYHTPWMTVPQFVSALTEVDVDGGGDIKETPIDGLGNLTNGTMLWGSEAYKFAILITDAGYKTNNTHGIADLEQMATLLQEQDIQVSTVTPIEVAAEYGALVAYTGGIQVELHGDFRADLLEYAQVVLGGARPPQDYLFRVADSETNLPVAGALVTWNGGSAVTDSNGIVTIRTRSNPIPNVVISKVGYLNARLGNVDVTDKEIFLVPFTVAPEVPEEIDHPTALRPGMFGGISSGSGSLSGPKIRLLGRDYNLLDLDIAFNLGELDISIQGDSEEKKYQVIFGHEFENDSYWSDRYTIYKNIVNKFSQKSAQEIYNDFRRIRGNAKKSGNFLLNCDFFLGGYADISYASGTLDWSEGGLVLGISTGEKTIASGPFFVPWAFFDVTWQVDGKGLFTFKVQKEGKIAFIPQANIEVTPAITGTLNAGVKGLASVGGGLKGSLDTKFRIPFHSLREGLTVSLTGHLVANLKLLGFKLDAEEPFASIQLYPMESSRSSQAVSLFANKGAEDLQLIGAPTPVRVRSAKDQIRNGVYEDSAPQMAVLNDGRYLLVYVDMAPGSEIETALYYSLSEDGMFWSTPALVQRTGDGTSDYTPVLLTTSTGAVVIWQDRNSSANMAASFEDAAQDIQISAAIFDGISFGPEVSLTADVTTYKTTARLVADENRIIACWIETDPSNVMLSEGDMQICTSSFQDGIWSAPETLESIHITDGGLVGFDIGIVNGIPMAVYAENDTIYAYPIDSPTQVMTLDTDGVASSLQVVNGRLYWGDKRGLVSWDGRNIEIAADAMWLNGAEFTLLDTEQGRMALLRQSTGFANELYLAVEHSGWSTPVPITNYGMSLSTASAVVDDSGILHWTVGRTEVMDEITAGESPFGGSDLAVGQYTPEAKVIVDQNAYLSEMELIQAKAGDSVNISLQLSNQGAAVANGLYATVAYNSGEEIRTPLYVIEENSKEYTETIVNSLAAGETLWTEAKYTLPASWTTGTLTIRIYDATDKLLGSAEALLPGPAPDLVVEQVDVTRTVEGAVVTAEIRNNGATAEEVITTLMQEGISGAEEQSIGTLAANTSYTVTFKVDNADGRLTANNAYDYKRFIISVSESSGTEMMLANNSNSALLEPVIATQIRFTGLSETEQEEKTITLSADTSQFRTLSYEILPAGALATVSWISDNTQVAIVDENGLVQATGVGTANIRAIINESIGDTLTEAKIRVQVTGTEEVAVTDVILSPDSKTLSVGESATIQAMVLPENASNRNVRWSVEPAGIVELVEENGQVVTIKALTNGTAQITATTLDGGLTAVCPVTVGETSGNIFTVTFAFNNGDDPYAVTVMKNETVTPPEPPANGDFDFEGWYTDPSCTQLYDFNTPVTTSFTLYAGWKMVGPSVDYDDDKEEPENPDIEEPETPLNPTPDFTDVADDFWGKEAIDYVVAEGLMKGTSETTFAPNVTTTRAMLMTILARMDGVDTTSSNPWYQKGMEWAVAEGVSDGTNPEGTITREQLAVMLYRYSGSPAVSADALTFADGDAVSDWAVEGVRWAVANGILSGKGNDTLDPQGNATRAEVAQMLCNFSKIG